MLDDYNGPSQEGIGVAQLSAEGGHRSSTARGYLRTDPLDNLLVLTGARATRLVVEGSRATGVEVVGADGDRQTISATREVIVSAGTFDSPKLLMLSGIGPAAHLAGHGIDVVADLPVGDNLHDHLFVPVSVQMDSAVRRPTPAYFLRGLAQARVRRSGWAAGSQFDLLGFVRSSLATTAPDLQLHVLYWVYPFPNQDGAKAVRPPTTKPGLTVLPTLIYPESRGTVRLAGSDPTLAPLIDPAYLQVGKDVDVLLEGIAMTRQVLAGLGDSTGEVVPGPEYADPRRDPRGPAQHRALGLPPGRHLPDGLRRAGGRRPPAPGARHRGAPRRRRVGDAVRHGRQHQRSFDHDRRAVRRADPGINPVTGSAGAGPTDLDLTDLDRFVDGFPYDDFSRLRDEAPVWWHPPTVHTPGGEGFWVVSRYHDVVAAGGDSATFSSDGTSVRDGGGTLIEDLPTGLAPGTMLNMTDAPRHPKFRKLFHGNVAPRILRGIEDDLRERSVRIVDAALAKAECDFLVDVAAELPLQAVAQLLGVPQEDRHQLFAWATATLDYSDRDLGQISEVSQRAAAEMYAYGSKLLEQKREDPGDDIMSVVATALIDGEPLAPMEQQMVFSLLVAAGSETTRNSIAGGMLAFAEHPELWRELQEDRALLGTAIEEVLRWSASTPYNRRTAIVDTEIGRRADQGRRQGHAVVGVGQPRLRRVRRSGHVRHPTDAQPARRVRPRPALLPRGRACPHGDARHLRGAPRSGRRLRGHRTCRSRPLQQAHRNPAPAHATWRHDESRAADRPAVRRGHQRS